MASNRGIAWQRMGGRPHRSHANTAVAKRNAQMVESFKQRRMSEANRLMELRARRALLADAARHAAAAGAAAPAATELGDMVGDATPAAPIATSSLERGCSAPLVEGLSPGRAGDAHAALGRAE